MLLGIARGRSTDLRSALCRSLRERGQPRAPPPGHTRVKGKGLGGPGSEMACPPALINQGTGTTSTATETMCSPPPSSTPRIGLTSS
jgi:hypothetical protein